MVSGSSLETAYTIDTSSIKFGPGVTREVGYEMRRLGARRVMVVTDPRMASSEAVAITLESLRDEAIDAVLFDRVSVEPTDASFKEAIAFATEGAFDGFVAVGGGSSIDTAKAANLYATYPADFLAYVNAPIGEGRPVPGPLKPLIAIPTTSGDGKRDDRGCDFRPAGVGSKDGNRAQGTAAGDGHCRSASLTDAAEPSGSLQRLRCAVPRAGVVHGVAVQRA